MKAYDIFGTELVVDDCVVYINIKNELLDDKKYELTVGGIIEIIDSNTVKVEGFDDSTHIFPSEEVVKHCTQLHL